MGEIFYHRVSVHGRQKYLAIPECWLISRAVLGILPEVIQIRIENEHLELYACPPSKRRIATEMAERNYTETPREKMLRKATAEFNKISGSPDFGNLSGSIEEEVNTSRKVRENTQPFGRPIFNLDEVESLNFDIDDFDTEIKEIKKCILEK